MRKRISLLLFEEEVAFVPRRFRDLPLPTGSPAELLIAKARAFLGAPAAAALRKRQAWQPTWFAGILKIEPLPGFFSWLLLRFKGTASHSAFHGSSRTGNLPVMD